MTKTPSPPTLGVHPRLRYFVGWQFLISPEFHGAVRARWRNQGELLVLQQVLLGIVSLAFGGLLALLLLVLLWGAMRSQAVTGAPPGAHSPSSLALLVPCRCAGPATGSRRDTPS